ncbi:MAG: methyltransferase domain-containing protein [Planctomycetota bacterium]|nr:methyltransferase domain-containing protein [Planctomycetota bacterium]
MKLISIPTKALEVEEFSSCLRQSETYRDGSAARQSYIDGSVARLHRIVRNVLACDLRYSGPSLDIASGWGILFPAVRHYIANAMPYSVAEMSGASLDYDGHEIACHRFECDKDQLPCGDSYFGLVFLNDVIEHLIVDPLWTLLEINRVTRVGGHIVLATPNAIGAFRMLLLLSGRSPATEHEIKPASIYQRHNREWTPADVESAMSCCGFKAQYFSTNAEFMSDAERSLLAVVRSQGFTELGDEFFGPELLVVGEKVEHRTISDDLPKDLRWPTWLYTSFDAYRKRPQLYPIVHDSDYA